MRKLLMVALGLALASPAFAQFPEEYGKVEFELNGGAFLNGAGTQYGFGIRWVPPVEFDRFGLGIFVSSDGTEQAKNMGIEAQIHLTGNNWMDDRLTFGVQYGGVRFRTDGEQIEDAWRNTIDFGLSYRTPVSLFGTMAVGKFEGFTFADLDAEGTPVDPGALVALIFPL